MDVRTGIPRDSKKTILSCHVHGFESSTFHLYSNFKKEDRLRNNFFRDHILSTLDSSFNGTVFKLFNLKVRRYSFLLTFRHFSLLLHSEHIHHSVAICHEGFLIICRVNISKINTAVAYRNYKSVLMIFYSCSLSLSGTFNSLSLVFFNLVYVSFCYYLYSIIC